MTIVPHYEDQKRIATLSARDAALVQEMKPALEKHADLMIRGFYQQLDTVPDARALLDAVPGRRAILQKHLRNWMLTLGAGDYSTAYRDRRYAIGKRHVEVGIESWLVIAIMSYCRRMISEMVEKEYPRATDKLERVLALNKVMDIDLSIMLQSYEDKRIELFLETTGFSRALFEQMIRTG